MNDTAKFSETLIALYGKSRKDSLLLCTALENEDYGLQAMPEVSPPKWHLAHTSWFYETFVLKPFVVDYRPFNAHYEYLFNSYYHGVGMQYPRAQRGLLSRPTVKEVYDYREYVDRAMSDLLAQTKHAERDTIVQRCELGINHEQQHQELLCTDIKYSFSFNPLFPALGKNQQVVTSKQQAMNFVSFDAEEAVIGYRGEGFHFDNEEVAHRIHLPAFRLANRLVTNAEYLAFIDDGGYEKPALWLADGWDWKQKNNAAHPRYWLQKDEQWYEYTLYGLQPVNPDQPVSHVNYYEADACARWFDKRLPREQEWEAACLRQKCEPAHFPVSLHPAAAEGNNEILQMFGCLWQWTQSSYTPYPGYQPAKGAIGEYNGKFMCNQIVLRGSSCVTPPGHARPSYRNFFYPKDQWQFSGIRLADDLL